MSGRNGRTMCIGGCPDPATGKAASGQQLPKKNSEIEGNVHVCKNSRETHTRSEIHDNIKDTNGKETPHHRPGSSSPKQRSDSKPGEMRCRKPERFDCSIQGCQKRSCFDGLGFLPIEYPSPGKPCVPEYVHPRPPRDQNRRPNLPEPREMLSTLKQGIRHPFQITRRRKEMQTQLDKLTDEHEAFSFPPGIRPFVDNVYYLTEPASSLVENFDLIFRDIDVQKFPECPTRKYLLAFHRDEYKFFRERLPMPEKRILNIPGNRKTQWHNWTIRPLHRIYSESWRKDIKVPENWFGPPPPQIC